MRPDPEMIPVLIDTAKALKGSQKRLFMARTVKLIFDSSVSVFDVSPLAMGRGPLRSPI